ncbi:hypothetical protein CLV59_1011058 [Chitinophaga dinghuensis]|uniref:Uncharacterized protein n=1 Tax=Chitinophaga dinghuensis TaxID=1539050 RepID=A0A327WDV0_9BACT|nr:hypothetical protein [Chitinophaga dinghuensis]RAJ88288.1 hypothetical protein CLV59_1011058 [Chitinophaga dinghuensis]
MIRHLYLTILCLFAVVAAFAQEQPRPRTPLEQHIHDVNKLIQERRATKLLKNETLYSQLQDTTQFKLPVGIGGTGNGNPPVIIDSIRFLPDHAEITVYIVVPTPNGELMFAASSVPISMNGGLVGTARLELVNDPKLNLFGDKSEFRFLHGKTFVEFDCDGFKRLGIGAEVNLPEYIVPAGLDATQPTNQRVKATFEAAASDINDIIAGVSIQPFQIRGVKNVTITVQDAIIDLSDANNSPDVVFPKEYNTDDKTFWRGFFLRKFEVQLPPELRKRSSKKPLTFTVRNALIDDKGFSGAMAITNLLPLEDGDMGGWQFSVDKLGLDFVANQLKGGELTGELILPITAKENHFGYSAVFRPGSEYVFKVKMKDTVSVPIFIGKGTLLPNSSIQVAVKDGNFQAMAVLNGSLSITGGNGGEGISSLAKKFNVPDLQFERLTISTEAPYFHEGIFSFSNDLKMPTIAGYGFSIDEIGLVKKGEKRGLALGVKLNVSGTGTNGFAADAKFALMSTMDKDEDGKIHFKFSSLDVSRISIDIHQGVFALKGGLEFFTDDDIYGNGFRGDIDASLQICKAEVKLQSTALFGNVKGERYWYADIMVDLPVAITIFPPAVSIKGFGGALFYGVSVLEKGANTGPYRLGKTNTGIIYKPDANSGLGIKASLKFIALKEKTLSGDVGLELAFNRSGGLRKITFRGLVNVMSLGLSEGTTDMLKNLSGMMKDGQPADAPAGDCGYDPNAFNPTGLISAGLMVDVDFENSSLLANLKVYVDVYGVFTGVGPKGLAGEGEFYVGPEGWHLFAGKPDNPIGVSILGLAKAHAYFMVGNGLPGSPPPPAIVSEILGGMDLDYMRDLNALGKGSGFAFGAGLDFDTGDMDYGVFYARLRAGLGFDIMVKDYGNDVHCEGGSGPIGINGWYANGQIYGYFQGKIGIRVKLFFKKGNFDILELGAAVVLQGKLPNPSWMRGTVGGYFKLFGGMIRGNCRFQMTLGKECKIVGNNAFADAGVQVIADATPGNGDTEQSIFTAPQLVCNMPIGDIISISDDNGKTRHFRSRLEYMSLRKESANAAGTQEWNSDNTVVVLNTAQCLEPRSNYKLTARVTFEENENGSWTPYLVDGKQYAEEVNNTFTTGNLPDKIPEDKIKFTYPIRKQLNFYKDELPSHNGYIQFKQDLAPMFRPDSSFKQTARLIPANGDPIDIAFSYDTGRVSFRYPDGMKNDEIYTFALVNVPTENESDISRNVVSQKKDIGDGQSGDLSVTTKKATRSITVGSEKAFYQLDFRSSKYNTFNQKLDALGVGSSFRWPISNGVHELGYQYTNTELFDNAEVDGNGNSEVLQFEAILDDNTWYKEDIYPYTYAGYPITPVGNTAGPAITIDWRNPQTMGVPPVRAIYIRQQSQGLQLNENGNAQFSGISTFVFNLPYYIERDNSNVANRMVNNMYGLGLNYTDQQKLILTRNWVPVRKGDYKFRIKYVLPGINMSTSSRIITIQNPTGL